MTLVSLLPLATGAAAMAVALAAAPAAERSAGERAYQKCYSCHATEAGKNDLAGPTLHRIVGRPIAALTGVDYSPALKRFAARNPRWSADLLDRFAADPEGLVPGTSMAFHGMPDPAERRELIKYLEGIDP